MLLFLGLFIYLASLAMVKTSVLPARVTSPMIAADELEEKMEFISPLLFVLNTFVMDHDRHACVEKMFCVLESQFAADVNNPMKYVGKLLANSDGNLDDAAYRRMKELVRNYPDLEKVVGGIEYGRQVKNASMCDVIFPECNIPVNDMVAGMNAINGDTTEGRDAVQSSSHGLGNNGQPARVKRDNLFCKMAAAECIISEVGCLFATILSLGHAGVSCGLITATCAGVGTGCLIV